MKKYLTLGFIGLINILHASLHLIQFAQSVVLIGGNLEGLEHGEDHGIFEEIMHNPAVNIIWAFVGIFTLYLGIKDFIYHKKHTHEKQTKLPDRMDHT